MIFRKYKYSKIVAIAFSLSLANLVFNVSSAKAEVGKNRKHVSQISSLDTTQNKSLSRNLFLARSFANQDLEIDLREENLELVGLEQTIPLDDRTLIANSFRGRASWYGPGFHGRLTANGERYNQYAMTAAHPNLRFGTRVRVTNMKNGRSVVVRINDRGPFVGGRVIDLSAAAARSLNMIRSGVAPVKITVVGR